MNPAVVFQESGGVTAVHQALYRKYRPRTFDDMCGQEHITNVLKYEIAHGQISHAYLFCGSRGTGKTTAAKILARAVNCEAPVNGSPCGKCASCRLIDDGGETDILEMDAASNNKVDDIRAILDEVVYTPSSLKYRVYIVDEVHMLSQSAFNALLKTLEEPPSHVIFILATTELQKLPATIVSRCQRFDFRRISVPVLTSRLEYIAKSESIVLEHDAALVLARLAQGGMRDAISLLELCAGGRESVTVAAVNDAVGSTGRETVSRAVRALAAHDAAALFDIVYETDSSAKDISVFWGELISYYRDMLVVKIGADAVRYLDLTEAEAEALASDASMFSRETLIYHSRLLDEAYISMQRAGAIRRSVAEMTLLRMADERLDTRTEALLSRIAALENTLAGIPMTLPLQNNEYPVADNSPTIGSDFDGNTSAPTAASAGTASASTADGRSAVNSAAHAASPARAGTPASNMAAAENVNVTNIGGTCAAPAAGARPARKSVRSFAEIAERVSEADRGLGGFVRKCRAYTDIDDSLVICCETQFTKNLLARDKSLGILATAASAVLGRRLVPQNIKVEVLPAADDPDAAALLDEELGAIAQEGENHQ